MEIKEKTLEDVFIPVSLSQWFLMHWRKGDCYHTPIYVSKKQFNEIISAFGNQDEAEKFLKFIFVKESELVQVWKKEEWEKTNIEKDTQRLLKDQKEADATAYHKIVEEWKIKSLTALLKTGRLTEVQAKQIVASAMNPVTPQDRKFREKLRFPELEQFEEDRKTNKLTVMGKEIKTCQ